MDASSGVCRRDGLAAVSRVSTRCAAPARASPAAESPQRQASSPASAAPRETDYVLCERAADGQQRDNGHAHAVAIARRPHPTEVEAYSGVLTSSGYPDSATPCVSSALSCGKSGPEPFPAAACKGTVKAGLGSPAHAAAAALPLQRRSMETMRRRVPGPKPPLMLLSSNNTSSSSRSSSHEVPLGFSTAIERELTCPICLELFRLPVTVVCGHSFCRYCIGNKKLSRKACPLCRQDIGESFAVNTVLCNLLACFTSRRQHQQQRRNGSPVSTFLPLNARCTVYGDWWAQHCVKPSVAAPLAIRLLFPEIAEESGLLLDDLVACVLDAFDRKSLWADQRWCFTLKDAETLSRMVGFDQQDREATRERLHRWVESYVSALPSVCCRRGGGAGGASGVRFVVRVIGDRVHRIEGQVFDSHTIQQGLPWDMGRHQQSLLHVPHPSVSLSHLLLLREKRDSSLRIVDLGSTIGTMVKVSGIVALQSGDLIHIGDRVEVSVKIYPTSSARRQRFQGQDGFKAPGEDHSNGEARVEDCPYLLCQWDAARGKVVGTVLPRPDQPLRQPPPGAPANGEASASGFSWAGAAQRPGMTWHPQDMTLSAFPEVLDCGEGEEASEGDRRKAMHPQPCGSNRQHRSSDSEIREDSQRTTISDSLEDGRDPETLEPIVSFLLLKIHGNGVQEAREVWVDPRGIVLGRGPQNSTTDLEKLSVTASNGYVSRQHCVVYYDGRQPAGSKWMLKDVSTLGTFIRLKPLEPYPCSINPRTVFKVGQCKVEVAPWTMQQQHSQSVPVEVTLQRLPERQGLPSPPPTALPTHEHLRDLDWELGREEEAQTPAAGPATDTAAQHRLRIDGQLPRLHTSFPVFLPWTRRGSQGGQHGRRSALEEAESLCHPPNLGNLAASGQQPLTEEGPQLRRGDRAWPDSHFQQPQHAHRSTFPATLENIETALAELPLGHSQLSLPIVCEASRSSAVNLLSSGGTTQQMRPVACRSRGNARSTRGSFRPHRAHFDETAEPVDHLGRRLTNCQVPQHSEMFCGDILSSSQMQSSVPVEDSSPRQNGRHRDAGSGRRRQLPDFGNTRALAFGGPLLQGVSLGPMSCAMSEPFRVLSGDGQRRHFSPSGLLQGPFAGVGALLPGSSGSFLHIDSGQPAPPEALLEP